MVMISDAFSVIGSKFIVQLNATAQNLKSIQYQRGKRRFFFCVCG